MSYSEADVSAATTAMGKYGAMETARLVPRWSWWASARKG